MCLDLEGNVQWIRGLALDHPLAGNDVGMSSSPIVAGDLVVVQSEGQGDSFLEAIDVISGATRWQAERPKASNWCSPIYAETEIGTCVIAQSGDGIEMYRATDGQSLAKWEKRV